MLRMVARSDESRTVYETMVEHITSATGTGEASHSVGLFRWCEMHFETVSMSRLFKVGVQVLV